MRMLGYVSLAAIIPLGGCSDTSVNLEDADVLVLTQVSGKPLPATIDEGIGFSRRFVADTIWLLPDETWRRHQVEVFVRPDGSESDVDFESDGFVTLDDGVRVLAFECNDTVVRNTTASSVCVPPDRLVESGAGWKIQRDLSPGGPLLKFQRLARNSMRRFSHG
jgi:hypothetical protein